MKHAWRLVQRIALAALLAGFGAAAQGAIYTGHFDPPGDGSMPGFSGAAQFTIANDCFDMGNGWFSTSGEFPDCGSSTMDFAHVDLFPVDGSGFPDSPVDFFDVPGPQFLIGVLIIGGQLEGVDTNFMGPENGHSVFSDHSFWLQFTSDCINNSCFAALTLPPRDPAHIAMDTTSNVSADATVVFTPGPLVVPEPGTLALALGAVGAAWLRRRKTI